MRSLVDKLKHKIKTGEKNHQQSQPSPKNHNPVAKSSKITAQLLAQQPTTHVYIDGNNFKCSAHKLNMTINYPALKS